MSMEYTDFYDIAAYGNEAWKGSFTPKEVAQNAYDYLCEFRCSKGNDTITHTIKELTKLLEEDLQHMKKESEEYLQVSHWLYQIANELGLIDMDYHVYTENSEWLAVFL